MVYRPEDLLWGQYQVQRYLGSGGMAEVYHVRDGVGMDFAAKVVRADRLNNEAYSDRYLRFFRDEVDLHTQLIHPRIVRCYNAYVDVTPPGMVLQFVDGENLRSVIQRKQQTREVLENSEVLRIVRQISEALMYMHERRICHCDLKPGNILLDQIGGCFLTDFGVSQVMGPAGVTKGTWYYMAPEQFEREMVTAQTDIYSFAITIYEIITGGHRPFTDRTNQSENTGSSRSDTLREKHLYVDPPPPSHFNTTILPQVDEVILKALSKDPRDRHASTDTLVDALDQAFKARPAAVSRFLTPFRPASPSRPIRPARLICTRGQLKGQVFPIQKPSILIGRSKQDCDIEIPERTVSRRHVLISWAGEASEGGAFYLQDQGSTYRTRVNGRLQDACRLRQGDLISIVGSNFLFEFADVQR